MKYLVLLTLNIFLFWSCSGGPTTDNQPVTLAQNLNPQPQPATSLKAKEAWQAEQIFYHVWMRSFSDSNNDGIGDFRGLTAKLDYLEKELGVTALWLSPFFENASGLSNLHGYDVTNHFRVDPRFGTLEDVKSFLTQAHDRGIRVIFDFVPNHVSNKHPWFIESAKGPQSPLRDWFWWEEKRPSGWTGWDDKSDFYPLGNSYYYGVFWVGMPDLNYNNPEVVQAMDNAALYWLNLGFDGIRMDAVKYLVEDRSTDGSGYKDQPKTFQYFQNFRKRVLDPYTELGYAKFMVAENWESDYDNLMDYMVDLEGNKGFQMTFDFPLVNKIKEDVKSTGSSGASILEHWENFTNYVPKGAWLGTFLSNHDNVISRPATEYDSIDQAKLAATILLLGPGTPFIYYGNEVGMEGQVGQDVNLRTPMDWEAWSAQRTDPQSIFTRHREMIQLRKSRPSMLKGTVEPVRGLGENLLSFSRTWNGERTLVIINLGEKSTTVIPPQGGDPLSVEPFSPLVIDWPLNSTE